MDQLEKNKTSELASGQPSLLNATEDDSYLNKTHHGRGLVWESHFVQGDPYQSVRWEKRTAKIAKSDGTVVFEQRNVEVPDFWSQTATDIVASKYFRKPFGAANKENSARQMVDRVAETISGWGWRDGYFAGEQDYQNFRNDLKWILINQYGAFNSPVWFNVGVYERPQCSACQPYRALVSTPHGFFKIGEIVENNLIGLPVYDSFGTTKVVAVKNNGVKKVYKVSLRNGSFIEATGDHLIKAVHERRTNPIWVRTDQLKTGMRLQLYPHRAVEKKETTQYYQFQTLFHAMTADGQVLAYPYNVLSSESKHGNLELEISEASLAGWLQADGFVGQYTKGTNRSLTVEFLTVNDQEKEWIEKHLEVVFPDIHKKIRITKTKLGTPITRIRLYGEKLRYFVEKYELLKRREKIRVPDIMWKSSPKAIAAYLKSIFQGEGYVSVRKTKRDEAGRLAIATISQDWMHDIQILLYGLGIYSRILKKEEKRPDREDLHELMIGNGSEKIKFADLIGFIGNDKQVKLLAALNLKKQKNVGDLREEEIISIEELGMESVFDIQTESGEYLTNNIAVHNCFILAVEDTMSSILDWYRDEGWIFKFGSGAGTNLSKLRSSKEPLSRGGRSSGPVSFMKGADGVANSIRSGGETRRAAKMVVLNVDHPDIKDFIYCKKIIEDMTKALVRSGIKDSITADLFDPYALLPYQNANNSVRVSDEFMQAVENDDWWDLKSVTTGESLERIKAREILHWMADAAWHSADPGMQFDTITNDWHTCPKAGRINASNPCSEYVHLDNSACNLASINLLKFLRADGSFDVELYKKVIDTFILAQDILVDNSSYPTENITKNARNYRELGLGYANLGALLMTMGLAYDSDRGRAIAGLLTSVLTGEGYRMSAELARAGGPFRGFEKDREGMLGVIHKHYQEAENLVNGVDQAGMTEENYLKHEAVNVWREAFELGGQYGIRNSQATVLAPTGTISFLMDCATTGIEPELALVKYKKLVGGGTLKLVNPQVPFALKNLGYQEGDVDQISKHLLEKGTIEGAPGLKDEHLSVFDCSFKAQNGQRSIQYMGHIKMMSAAQPFISGAISKTVNLPAEATVEEIERAFVESWKHGLKAVAFYRDGSKTIQPLNTSDKDKELVEKINGHTRFKMPAIRPALIHKFSVGGHEGYLTVGMYPGTKKVGETFITIAKEGSTVSGLLDAIATLTSISLQSGVPLKILVKKFKDMRFEPSGMTSNEEIPFAKSIIDYIFKFLGQNFLKEEEREEVFGAANLGGPSIKPVATLTLAASQNALTVPAGLPEMDTEATVCECGSIMVRAGSCYSCPNCFSTTGVCN
ncbi:MAG: vitamin B12-dependent ribonucleotide reductase [bacterium]|nr:vitamin B12-dependent ribonucleotide reductase [bacterium]